MVYKTIYKTNEFLLGQNMTLRTNKIVRYLKLTVGLHDRTYVMTVALFMVG